MVRRAKLHLPAGASAPRPGDFDDLIDLPAPTRRRTPTEKPKNVHLVIPRADWRLIRAEAARRNISLAALLREWIAPHLQSLERERQD